MAIILKVGQARLCAMGLTQTQGAYSVVIDYCLQTDRGGKLRDLLLDGAQQRIWAPQQPGHPLPEPAHIAALIRQDCLVTFGGQPEVVWVNGTPA